MSIALRQPRNTWTSPSTPHQRLYIRTLMTQLDLDSTFVTLFHKRYFETARLPVPVFGERIDSLLCALTRDKANALIGALKKEVPDDE